MAAQYDAEAWRHLADCLRAARDGRPVSTIAKEAGISHATIEAYESGRVYRRPPDKLWRLVNFYRWTPDSLRRVLTGGLPDRFLEAPAPAQEAGIEEEIRQWITGDSGLTATERKRKLGEFEKLISARRAS